MNLIDNKLSYVGMHSHDNFEYAIQYKKAFFTLYESGQPIDTIALPMMFLLRHYLELALKYNIEFFQEFSSLDCNNIDLQKEHKLYPLSNCFREHLGNVFDKIKIPKEETLEYFIALNELVNIVNHLDKQSMSFRYSHNNKTNAQKHLDWRLQINFDEIKLLLDNLQPLLVNSIDVFEDKTGLMHGNNKENVLKEFERNKFDKTS